MARPPSNIRRRGRSWVLHYRRDGKQVWRSFADRDYGNEQASLEAAELELARAKVRKIQGQPEPASRSITLDTFAPEWLTDYARAHVGEQTYVNYESVLRVHVLPSLGHLELRQITRKILAAFVSDWATGGPVFQERVAAITEAEVQRAREQDRKPRPVRVGRSPKTISNAIVVIREMLGHAVEWNYLVANPAVGLRRPRDDRETGEQMRPLDPDGVRKLLDACTEQLDRALLMTAVMTGARRGELLGLTWADVDWDRRRLWIRRSVGLGGQVKRPKSRRSVRAIALTPTLVAELRRHRMASKAKAETDPVFASSTGTPLDGRNLVRVIFEPALKRAGLPHMRFHDLRHTFASLLIAQGAHPKYISEQLGHASVQITLDRYGHLFDQSYGDESAKLETALFGAQSEAAEAVEA
jgi:integrase